MPEVGCDNHSDALRYKRSRAMPSELEVSSDNAHAPAQEETTSIEKGMALDHVNEFKTGQAICDTSSFTDSSFTKTLRNLHTLVRYYGPFTFTVMLFKSVIVSS